MNGIKVLVAATLLLGGCGGFYPGDPSETKPRFAASLTGDSPAKGSLTANYSPSRRLLSWRLSYSGLSGPITWAEFRGPDIEGGDFAIVSINTQIEGNPHPGGATLTDQQAADLIAGRWSVVIKTEKYPGGELKGPVVGTGR
jgi:CHRD domain